MKNQSLNKFVPICILFWLVGFVIFISCTTSKTKEPITIGTWTAASGFGGFDFTVDSSRTQIIEIVYKLSNWTIGGATHSGSIKVGRNPGWPIDDRQFTIENYLDPGDKNLMTINGSFHDNGIEASGSWDADFDGATDSGTWQASPED